MKKTLIVSLLFLLSQCVFAQLDGVDVNGIVNNPNNYLEKERQDIENTLRPEVEAHNKKQKSQSTQKQNIDIYNNMISNDGQRRMEYNNNPQNYINRDLTNRNSANIGNNNQLEQHRDMRSDPINSDNLNSKSLQYLREANRGHFSDNHDIGMGGDAKVILFDAPSLDGYYGEFNEGNVRRYLNASESLAESFIANPTDLNSILFDEFARVSGFNIDDIINTMPDERTIDETQALADFQEFRIIMMERIADEIEVLIDNSIEKKEIDSAILAFDVYGTDEDGYINNTNYKKIDLKKLLDSNESFKNPIYNVATSINECNKMHDGTGIHVELYYNEVTNTYVISCAGSDDSEDWLLNNAANALESDVPQYMMAKTIGDAIKQIPQTEREKLNIEVVGHSLGGGMASIIGLTTGVETKTYNAARVPENFLKDNGLYDKVNNGEVQNIIAYHTSTDILTNTQNTIGTPAIGVSVDIGDPATSYEKTKAVVAGGVVGAMVGNPVAGAVVGEMAEGHRMRPMVRNIYNEKMLEKKFEWDYMRRAQLNLRNAARR